MKTKEQIVDEILSRGVSEVIDRENLRKKLLSGKKLRIKFGTDPTSPSIHLGRAVVLLKLRDLQELGHQIVFIIGDFTGVIGDTSDKESERPMLDREVVEKNLETYFEQAGKILDMSKVEKHRNSTWLGKLTYNEISEQADIFSLSEFIARDNIKKRLEKGTRISLRELLYPLMQGYDSVMLKADVELGGTDQRFNLLSGREMQRHYKQEAQDVLMVNLIEGTDGRKMSSSWGNVIKVMDEPNDMFGKVMSMGDELIEKYYIHCTRVPLETVEKIKAEMADGTLNPRDAKLDLAKEIVKIYHDEQEAEKAKEYFIKTVSNKEIPDDIQELKLDEDANAFDAVFAFFDGKKSKTYIKSLFAQGGVCRNQERVMDADEPASEGDVFKIGKRNWFRIVR